MDKEHESLKNQQDETAPSVNEIDETVEQSLCAFLEALLAERNSK